MEIGLDVSVFPDLSSSYLGGCVRATARAPESLIGARHRKEMVVMAVQKIPVIAYYVIRDGVEATWGAATPSLEKRSNVMCLKA